MNIQQVQEQYEVNTWLRMLDFQQQENVYMKTRIAEMIKYSVNKDVLSRLEEYQNIFINKDAIIALLRRDILLFSTRVAHDVNSNVADMLRVDIRKMEVEFNALRSGFSDYMLSTVSF